MFGIHLPSPRRVFNTVSHAAHAVSHTVSHAAHSVGHAASSVAHRSASTVSHAAHGVSHAAHNVSHAAHSVAHHVSSFEHRAVSQARHFVSHARTAAHHVRSALRHGTHSVARGVSHAAHRVSHSAHSLVRSASHARHSLSSGAHALRRAGSHSLHRLSHAASGALHRSGVSRGAHALGRAASRAVHSPVARRLGHGVRTAGRALGHAHALAEFGQNVGKSFGSARTAAHDIRQALRTHKLSDVRKAFTSTREAIGSVKDLVGSAAGARDALRAAGRTFRRLAPNTANRLSHAASSALHRSGLSRGIQALRGAASRVAHNPLAQRVGRGLNLGRRALGHADALYNFGRNVAHLPGQALTAARDIRRAIRTHSVEDVRKAIDSAKGFVGGAKGVVEGAAGARNALRAGLNTFRRVAPRVSARLGQAATRALQHGGARALGRVAQRVGTHSAARAAARIGGRALGRFAPGANIAMAGLDTAAFVNTLRDPHASTGKKVLAGVRALGSIAAATNIPILSQAGAAVSTVADIASSIHLPKIHLPKVHLPKIHLW